MSVLQADKPSSWTVKIIFWMSDSSFHQINIHCPICNVLHSPGMNTSQSGNASIFRNMDMALVAEDDLAPSNFTVNKHTYEVSHSLK